jgi:hypothetical protein
MKISIDSRIPGLNDCHQGKGVEFDFLFNWLEMVDGWIGCNEPENEKQGWVMARPTLFSIYPFIAIPFFD